MCKIRTLIINADDGNIKEDTMRDVGEISLNVIDVPAMCIYVSKNNNGYENLQFKYSNIIEDMETISSKTNCSFMTIGRKSGCIYSYQFKQGTSFLEMDELKCLALQQNDNIRFQTNIKTLLNLLQQIYESLCKRPNEK